MVTLQTPCSAKFLSLPTPVRCALCTSANPVGCVFRCNLEKSAEVQMTHLCAAILQIHLQIHIHRIQQRGVHAIARAAHQQITDDLIRLNLITLG